MKAIKGYGVREEFLIYQLLFEAVCAFNLGSYNCNGNSNNLNARGKEGLIEWHNQKKNQFGAGIIYSFFDKTKLSIDEDGAVSLDDIQVSFESYLNNSSKVFGLESRV